MSWTNYTIISLKHPEFHWGGKSRVNFKIHFNSIRTAIFLCGIFQNFIHNRRWFDVNGKIIFDACPFAGGQPTRVNNIITIPFDCWIEEWKGVMTEKIMAIIGVGTGILWQINCHLCSMHFKCVACRSDDIHSLSYWNTCNTSSSLHPFTMKFDTEKTGRNTKITRTKYPNLTGFYLLQSLLRTLKMVQHISAYAERRGRRLGGSLRTLASFRLLFIELWLFVAQRRTQMTHKKTRNKNDNDGDDDQLNDPPNLSSHPFCSFHLVGPFPLRR